MFPSKLNKEKLLGICGESGGGKSTLAKVIAGIIKPDSGKIILNSELRKKKKQPNSNTFSESR